MCGCEIIIQAVTYQESIKYRHKQGLKFLKNCAKLFISRTGEN